MTDELYLIAHKVRGEPAFDIAIRITIGDEEGWVIPTSGHRAYPAMAWDLRGLKYNGRDIETEAQQQNYVSLEDHYPSRPATEPPPTALGILAKLGLGRKAPTITRRV